MIFKVFIENRKFPGLLCNLTTVCRKVQFFPFKSFSIHCLSFFYTESFSITITKQRGARHRVPVKLFHFTQTTHVFAFPSQNASLSHYFSVLIVVLTMFKISTFKIFYSTLEKSHLFSTNKLFFFF